MVIFTPSAYDDRHNLRRIEKELSTSIDPIPKEIDLKLYVAEAQIPIEEEEHDAGKEDEKDGGEDERGKM